MSASMIGVGDVLAVRTTGVGAWFIRLGARLRGLPHSANHVVVAHHVDPRGVMIGLEGRPGGVGWVDMTDYLASPATVDNRAQPKTAEQRYRVAKSAEAMLGAAYDWPAIAALAGYDAGLPLVEDLDWHDGHSAPLHVICSAYAAYLYGTAGLPHPVGERFVQPADWVQFINDKEW